MNLLALPSFGSTPSFTDYRFCMLICWLEYQILLSGIVQVVSELQIHARNAKISRKYSMNKCQNYTFPNTEGVQKNSVS